MAVVQVLMMMGLTMSLPLLPLFLEKDLGLARGRDVELWAGLIAASSFLTVTIFTPIWGSLADRYGRRIMVVRSTAAVGVFNLLVVLVTNQYQLLAVRLGMGVLSGFGAAATSLVGSVAPRERLGYALGILGTAQTVGVVFGPLLGGLISTYAGYRIAFLFTGVLSLAACLVAATLVREDFKPLTREEISARPGLLRGLAAMARSRDLVVMFVVLALNRLTIGGIGPITSLYVGELAVRADLVPTVAGLALSVAGVGSAITSPLLGRLADRVGYKPVLLTCLAGAAVLFLPQAWVTTAWQFLLLRFAFGLFSGGIQPAAYAIIGSAAPPGRQSAAYGLTFSANAMGNFAGPVLSGLMAATFGLRPVFVYTAFIVAANAVWVATRVRHVGGRRETKAGPDASV